MDDLDFFRQNRKNTNEIQIKQYKWNLRNITNEIYQVIWMKIYKELRAKSIKRNLNEIYKEVYEAYERNIWRIKNEIYKEI